MGILIDLCNLYLYIYHMEYAGLKITVELHKPLCAEKTEMLVPFLHWRLWEKMGFPALLSYQ